MLDRLAVLLIGLFLVYSVVRNRKEVLYAFFLALIFGTAFFYAGLRSFYVEFFLAGSLVAYYPLLLLFLPLFLWEGGWKVLGSFVLGMGFGALARRGSRKVERDYGEVKRKVFHVISGLVIFLVAFLFGKVVGVAFMALVALVTFLLPRINLPLVGWTINDMVEARGERPAEGAFNFAVGSLLPLLIGQPWIVLALGFGDGVSTLVGKFFGRTRIYRKKSLEGALAEFLVVLVIARFFYPVPIIPAAIYTLVELFSPIDDNLSIPAALSLLYILKPL